jgi:hypothetical protein
MPDSSLVGGSAVRFGAILDHPIVLPHTMTPATAYIARISSLRPSGAPDFAMIPKAAEHGRCWDNPMSGSAPWTIDRNFSQVEAYRHHVL